ncbi:hypothetical protein ACFQ3S_06235, partial [Mucilaginibacter terrae]|uniref:hypothetical protein n=1 Tax=Mucilaginibacter terrae TaxID=1955052 RepID=UPI00363837AD
AESYILKPPCMQNASGFFAFLSGWDSYSINLTNAGQVLLKNIGNLNSSYKFIIGLKRHILQN